MSNVVRLYAYAVTEIDGDVVNVGNLHIPNYLTVDGQQEKKIVSLGTETTLKLWDVDDSALTAFKFLWIQTDYDIMLELVTDDDADVGEEVYTVELQGSGRANVYGMPFILNSDASYANYTVAFGGGTLDVIETIRGRNLDTTNTAKVLFWIVQ
jgi:hypothetical protein